MKKINPLKLAIFQAKLLSLVGLVLGIIYSVGGFIIDLSVSLHWFTSEETPGLSYGTFLAFGALLGMPLILATMGFIIGGLSALIHNALPSSAQEKLRLEP